MIDLDKIDLKISQANQEWHCSNCGSVITPYSYCLKISKYARVCLTCIPKLLEQIEMEQELYKKQFQILKNQYKTQLNKMRGQNIVAKLKWEQQKY